MGIYRVVRFYQDERPRQIIKSGLSLEEASKHCNDPATSSMTAPKPEGCDNDTRQIEKWHQQNKHWFDGYESEGIKQN